MAKNTTSKVLVPTTEVLPANPADTVVTVDPTSTRPLIIADASVIAENTAKVAKSVGLLAFLQEKGSVAREDMLEAIIRVRQMFPAPEAVRAILGEDTPDLGGQTKDYQNAVGDEVYATARKECYNRLRRDGYSTEVAKLTAAARVEALRKSLTRDMRFKMEEIASGQKNPAVFLLAHGYAYNGQLGKDQILGKGDHLNPETGALVKGAQAALDAPPVEQSDQATSTETADAEIAAAAAAVEESLTNPASRLNFAIGEIRTAAKSKRIADMTSAEGRGHLVNLLSVVSEAILAIGPNLTDKDRNTVAAKLQAMGATALVGMELASK